MRLLRVIGIVLLFFGFFAEQARAQYTWNRVGSFGTSIGCGFFFDADHGLIGSGVRRGTGETFATAQCAIYKTTDGGASWKRCALPVFIDGAVSSIWMVDTLTGYASIVPAVDWSITKTFGGSSLWKTTDGGDTWFDPYHVDHAISSVYAQNGLLLITQWDRAYYSDFRFVPPDTGGADISFDNGSSWASIFRRGNGIAFSDSLNGVVTEMNPAFGGNNFWCTFDAGRSWQATGKQYESWSIYSPPNSRMYFTANEAQQNVPDQSVNWSTDGGMTWRERFYFPAIRFTGTIAGKGHTLYVQTDSTEWLLVDPALGTYRYSPLPQYGLFRSDDLGANWRYVGGPANSRDTRFCVTGCSGEVVYAFDGYGGVYKTTDGGDGSIPNGNPYDAELAFDRDTVVWAPAPCGDSTGGLLMSRSCVPFTVDSIACIRGDLVTTSDSTLPKPMYYGDALTFRSSFEPSHLGDDTAVVRVFYHAAYQSLWRDIPVYSSNGLAEGLELSRDSSLLDVPGCVDAEDTILLGSFGCGGMILDSAATESDEVTVSNKLPAALALTRSFPLRLHFKPDSAGERSLSVRLFTHAGRRHYDTVIAVTARSVEIPVQFILDSTSLGFTTKYCRLTTRSLTIATPSCDTLWLDSLRTGSSDFRIRSSPAWISSNRANSIAVGYTPDTIGTHADTLHIFGHGRKILLDTTIILTGTNAGVQEGLTLSKDSLALHTSVCTSVTDAVIFSNQGCDLLYLDSIVTAAPLSVSFDTTRFPLTSNDSIPIVVRFDPTDGSSRMIPVRLVMHTEKRKIDTIIWASTANTIPKNPVILSTDSLWMWTKYCQPVQTTVTIYDSGCDAMTIDSAVIERDTRREFALTLDRLSVESLHHASASITFTPDTSGLRNCSIHVFMHYGALAKDTIIKLNSENHTAPEPYIPPLPSIAAGKVLRIPVMLHPTLDTFSLSSFAFQLYHNTDLLTTIGLDFSNSCSIDTQHSFANVEGSGTVVRVKLAQPITNRSDLTKPILYLLDSVRLAPDTITDISIASFATDREAAVIACSIPGTQFALDPVCGNPSMLLLLRDKALTLEITGVSPNPSEAAKSWTVDYSLKQIPTGFSTIVYDARGSEVYRSSIAVASVGAHRLSVPVPVAEGDYFLVLEGSHERVARQLTVRH